MSANFSTETLQARKEWHDIFKGMKRKNLQSRILYPAGLSFIFDGEIKNFPNMGKETFTQVQELQSARQDKSKKEHAETHTVIKLTRIRPRKKY